MKFILKILALAIVGLAPVADPNTVRSAQPAPPISYGGLAFAPYNQFRVDYDLLPVQVVGIRGGGPRPEDKFKVEASMKTDPPGGPLACLRNLTLQRRQ